MAAPVISAYQDVSIVDISANYPYHLWQIVSYRGHAPAHYMLLA